MTFKAKKAIDTPLAKRRRQRGTEWTCKVNNYNCDECIYHEHLFNGIRYIGTVCRLKSGDKNDKGGN